MVDLIRSLMKCLLTLRAVVATRVVVALSVLMLGGLLDRYSQVSDATVRGMYVFGFVVLAELALEELWIAVTTNDQGAGSQSDAVKARVDGFTRHADSILTTAGVVLGLITVFGGTDGALGSETQRVAGASLALAVVGGLGLHQLLAESHWPETEHGQALLAYLFCLGTWLFYFGILLIGSALVWN